MSKLSDFDTFCGFSEKEAFYRVHEDNFLLLDDFGLVHKSEDDSHGVGSVRSGDDRERAESVV